MLILRTFAKRKEVVISRSELIEIGGSFRIPEIMAASDCKMIEVGTTNKSYITDFEKVINPKTALLFKAHKSNYVIKGFTHEVDIKQLVDLGVSHSIPVVFDQGSGLLDNTISPFFENESDIKSTIELGVDLVSFSGDKLLGGPQAGIIVGKKKYIDKLKKEPMLRALRVCKLTLSVLESTLQTYINPKKIAEKNATYSALLRNENEIKKLAQRLVDEFRTLNISSEIESSQGFCGGGTLPEKSINSFAVYLNFNGSKKQQVLMAEKMHHHLLMQQTPVLSVLKSGKIYFDVLCLYEKDIAQIISAVENVNQSKSV
jgi:L-seryl-tRNA(Ser) seleniumtransferase